MSLLQKIIQTKHLKAGIPKDSCHDNNTQYIGQIKVTSVIKHVCIH